MTSDECAITADELEDAFKEFDRLHLQRPEFFRDSGLVRVMGKYTNQHPMISAGCETGIKLGLLIAESRRKKR